MSDVLAINNQTTPPQVRRASYGTGGLSAQDVGGGLFRETAVSTAGTSTHSVNRAIDAKSEQFTVHKSTIYRRFKDARRVAIGAVTSGPFTAGEAISWTNGSGAQTGIVIDDATNGDAQLLYVPDDLAQLVESANVISGASASATASAATGADNSSEWGRFYALTTPQSDNGHSGIYPIEKDRVPNASLFYKRSAGNYFGVDINLITLAVTETDLGAGPGTGDFSSANGGFMKGLANQNTIYQQISRSSTTNITILTYDPANASLGQLTVAVPNSRGLDLIAKNNKVYASLAFTFLVVALYRLDTGSPSKLDESPGFPLLGVDHQDTHNGLAMFADHLGNSLYTLYHEKFTPSYMIIEWNTGDLGSSYDHGLLNFASAANQTKRASDALMPASLRSGITNNQHRLTVFSDAELNGFSGDPVQFMAMQSSPTGGSATLYRFNGWSAPTDGQTYNWQAGNSRQDYAGTVTGVTPNVIIPGETVLGNVQVVVGDYIRKDGTDRSWEVVAKFVSGPDIHLDLRSTHNTTAAITTGSGVHILAAITEIATDSGLAQNVLPNSTIGGGHRVFVPGEPSAFIEKSIDAIGGLTMKFRLYGTGTGSVRLKWTEDSDPPGSDPAFGTLANPSSGSLAGDSKSVTGLVADDGATLFELDWQAVSQDGVANGDNVSMVLEFFDVA